MPDTVEVAAEARKGGLVSVFFLNLIPVDPAWVPAPDRASQSIAAFERHILSADEIKAEFLDGIQFVDQGSNFESVSCPSCGRVLDLAWWGEKMDAAWLDDLNRFGDLSIRTPCCDAGSSLNDLAYESPAGFASFALRARNPSPAGWLPAAQLADIATALGSPLRQVSAHY